MTCPEIKNNLAEVVYESRPLPEEIRKHPLRLGISMEVTVDLHNTELREIPLERKPIPLYQTDVLSHQEKGADLLIEKIITANLSPTFLETMNQEKL